MRRGLDSNEREDILFERLVDLPLREFAAIEVEWVTPTPSSEPSSPELRFHRPHDEDQNRQENPEAIQAKLRGPSSKH